ncbi:MAG: outer membrane protein assembly factor BamC [Gammaproteobacteria bacterium]|nr:outer membrane protein assembly factor BamC [Gammaproteobacteria bacterium]MDH3858249.1 outer membrane protein assembly factor BamC [Gammaproteobacteria bacterium]
MKLIPAVSVLLLAALLAACQGMGADKRYLEASLGRNLELPPDLSENEEGSSFELPTGFSGNADGSTDKVPVLARVESLRLEGSGDLYWLNVDEPVDNLYQLVKIFWFSEGYRLVVDEPVIGIMQTEWVLTEQGTSEDVRPWYQRLFASDDLSASQDQFKTRIELDPNGQGGRIYIAHRGTEYVHVLETTSRSQTKDDSDGNQWRFRQPEPELEIEMLSRLMIYLGLQKAEVEQQVADIKLLSPRAFQHIDPSEKSPFLIVKDPYQIAWNRIYHQLERMNFEIESAKFKRGLLLEGVIIVNAQFSESEEQKGLFSFFSSSSENVKKQIVVVLAEETHEHTRVMIETSSGDFDTSPEGAAFLDLLYRNIR